MNVKAGHVKSAVYMKISADDATFSARDINISRSLQMYSQTHSHRLINSRALHP